MISDGGSSLLTVFYVSLVLVAPLLPPTNGVGDTPPLPYYLCVSLAVRLFHAHLAITRYCVVGTGILLLGPVYWAGWRIILPRVFGYELVPRKEVLSDGTVVTVVGCFTVTIGLFRLKLLQFSRK